MNMDIKTMTNTHGQVLRCAAYVRKSSEDGLEQDYNSLDCQLDAISAYVQSQVSNGWVLSSESYSDGGYSGGNTDRPGLTKLRQDIERGLIDIVIVYKIDRLSRSISDFCDLSKEFDQHNVRFVSVTQQIDTSNAVGRMLLNILVSFSQFEREMASDRIRDKIRSAKAKGLWMGGHVPFGYRLKDKKLVIEPNEADQVKKVFELYARYGEISRVCREMKALGLERGPDDRWSTKNVFTCIRNHRYIGMISIGDKQVQGEHEAIISLDTWQKVQTKISENPRHGIKGRTPNPHATMLKGVLFCGECGSSMSYRWCTNSKNPDKQYGYYQCNGAAKLTTDCSFKRIPSAFLESEVYRQIALMLSRSFNLSHSIAARSGIPYTKLAGALARPENFGKAFSIDELRAIITASIERILVRKDVITMAFKLHGTSIGGTSIAGLGPVSGDTITLTIPVSIRCISGSKRLNTNGQAISGDRLESNPLLQAVVRAFAWTKLLDEGKFKSVSDLNKELNIDNHYLRHTLRLATLSPRIIRAILSGNEPEGLSLGKIRTVESDIWSVQEEQLGFPSDQSSSD